MTCSENQGHRDISSTVLIDESFDGATVNTYRNRIHNWISNIKTTEGEWYDVIFNSERWIVPLLYLPNGIHSIHIVWCTNVSNYKFSVFQNIRVAYWNMRNTLNEWNSPTGFIIHLLFRLPSLFSPILIIYTFFFLHSYIWKRNRIWNVWISLRILIIFR